jgi:hypothetical protein
VQAVIASFEAGLIPASEKKRILTTIDLLPKRVVAETGFREREKAAAVSAKVAPLVAQHQCRLSLLKLNGHAMDTLGRARDAGLGEAAALRDAASWSRATLERTVGDFQAMADLARYLPAIRTGEPGTWRLWFGDTCHAIHGLSLWPGA